VKHKKNGSHGTMSCGSAHNAMRTLSPPSFSNPIEINS
jgi:hypothetical protein